MSYLLMQLLVIYKKSSVKLFHETFPADSYTLTLAGPNPTPPQGFSGKRNEKVAQTRSTCSHPASKLVSHILENQ